jgi:outer membrane protein OmpA-like peptidoglycan-associated protein
MKRLFTIALILFAAVAFAQSGKEKRADKAYNRLAYSKAAKMYEELAADNRLSDRGIMHLGDCYRLTGRWGRAEQWYGKLATGANPTPEVVYYYAQSLRFNGKYAESKQQMMRFYQLSGSDTRAKEFSENPDFADAIQAQQPYFEIKTLDVNTEKSDFGATWYGNRIVFASSRPYRVSKQNFHSYNGSPFLDMYQADRDANNGQLTGVTLLNSDVSTKYHEGPACFTPDGKTMYFTRNNYFNGKYGKSSNDINNLKIFRAKWNGSSWTEENLAINSDEFSVGHPALSGDGNWLYFASDMPGGKGETDIWRVALNGDGTLGQPENLGGNVNTEGKEMFPFVDKDGNLYYASDGHLGLGGLDIFYSPSDGKGAYGKSINPGLPLNSSADDFSLVLDAASQAGYFSSNREGGKGDDDIYAVTMLRPMKPAYKLNGLAKQKGADVLLAGVEITLKDANGNVVETVTTGIDGSYSFTVEPNMTYTIVGTKEKYFNGVTTVKTEFGEKSEMKSDVTLEKDPGLSLYVMVKDKVSNAPLDSVLIKVTDNMNGGAFGSATTTSTGDYRTPIADKKIGDRISYNVTLERPGYLAKTITINQSIEKEGEIAVPETMDKIAVGLDLAKIIDIKPIYFDLGKSIIRPDAALELDKIVKVMNENPNMVVELGSHTDCRSSAASNMSLSERRAKASADYIKKRITNPDRIYGKGYGETQLTNGCECEGAVKSACPEEEHQKNRRTEFKIIKM